MNAGPQAMASIVISNGVKIFVDGTFAIGSEFCIEDDGAALPEELFVFVNAPMGGMTPESNQLSVIDSTCNGQGLTLLESYGSLDLVHYINCNGDNDCFVPVNFGFTVMNDGPTGLTITELASTVNGIPGDLIAGVDESRLILTEGQTFVAELPIVAECCQGVGLDASATVVAVGDDGIVCEDDTALNFDKPIETPPPTSGPSPSPSDVPSPSPSDIPSAGPSPSPSGMPSAGPSPSPSDVPSGIPTRAPTICEIELDVECVPPIDPGTGLPFSSCDFFGVVCNEQVTLFSFRYTGGDCGNSFNIQDEQIFVCEDYFGGPPDIDEVGAESLIVVSDIKGLGVMFFTGVVPIGGDFDVRNPDGPPLLVDSNVNVTIYEGERARENIRQTMVIHTSCSQVTFLKDRYGSLLLIAFENPSQGLVDCFFDVSFTYTVQSRYTEDTTLNTMLSIFGGFDQLNVTDFTPTVQGTPLIPGETFSLTSGPIQIDVSERIRYTVFTTIQAVLDEGTGFFCRSSSFTNFTSGLTDNRPTAAPSSAPSV